MPPEDPDNAEQTPDQVFLSAALFELALAALALFLGWAIGPSARATVPELVIDEVWPILSNVLLGCVAAGPILLFVEIIRRIPWEPIRELERLTDDGMLRTLLQLRPPELIMVSICAAPGGFCSQGAKVLYLGNEEKSMRTKLRAVQACSGMTREQIAQKPDLANSVYMSIRGQADLQGHAGLGS